jgi:hypothetical protein
MANNYLTKILKYKNTPYIGVFATLLIAVIWLYEQGRIWICSCGYILLWAGNPWSSDNSQHIADPYSSSHFLHGLFFFWIIQKLFPKMKWQWNLFWTVLLESGWEILENSEMVINRYREATASLGYTGDTILNSFMDILFCIAGFFFYKKFGFKISLIVFILTEIIMTLAIRDGLILNIIMLIYPLDAIRMWQMG